MHTDFSIRSIFKRYRWKVSLTFLLLVLENVFKVLQPLVLGIAINDLISDPPSNKGCGCCTDWALPLELSAGIMTQERTLQFIRM